jgi:hypothetical protein
VRLTFLPLKLEEGTKKSFSFFTLEKSLSLLPKTCVSILFTSLIFITKSSEDHISLLQQTKFANDFTAVLDYNKKFDSLNSNTINNNILANLPENYNMSFSIMCKNKIIHNLKKTPEKFVASGERVVVTDNLDYCLMRYWLWQN